MKDQVKLQERLVRLMEQPIRVHSEEAFDDPEAVATIMSPIPDYDGFIAAKKEQQVSQAKVEPELRLFYEEPLLTREQEYHWFRQFNFLKHHAIHILKESDPTAPVAGKVEEVEKLLAQAAVIKGQLARSNVRLAMSMAKKQKEYLINPNIDLLAEIVSDGYMGLVRAVDYFDYRLGNKFSTYATWAILDTMKTSRNARLKHATCSTNLDEELYEVPEKPDDSDEHIPLAELLDEIPPRQREIIINYYGIGTHHQNLKEIGEKMNLSKERIRQLRDGGLDKLRTMLGSQVC